MGDTDGLHGFPRSVTSFVGRAADVAEVDDLLAADPLVTVTGTGGVGKTRLACEVAAAAGVPPDPAPARLPLCRDCLIRLGSGRGRTALLPRCARVIS